MILWTKNFDNLRPITKHVKNYAEKTMKKIVADV